MDCLSSSSCLALSGFLLLAQQLTSAAWAMTSGSGSLASISRNRSSARSGHRRCPQAQMRAVLHLYEHLHGHVTPLAIAANPDQGSVCIRVGGHLQLSPVIEDLRRLLRVARLLAAAGGAVAGRDVRRPASVHHLLEQLPRLLEHPALLARPDDGRVGDEVPLGALLLRLRQHLQSILGGLALAADVPPGVAGRGGVQRPVLARGLVRAALGGGGGPRDCACPPAAGEVLAASARDDRARPARP